MTYLFIESVLPAEFRVGLLRDDVPHVRIIVKRSHAILMEVMKELKKVKKIDGIIVVKGPGSFTAIRTGVLIANVLARILRVPLNGASAGMVLPEYISEPNITLKKT